MDAYKEGHTGLLALWVSKKYKGHRCIPHGVMMKEVRQAFRDACGNQPPADTVAVPTATNTPPTLNAALPAPTTPRAAPSAATPARTTLQPTPTITVPTATHPPSTPSAAPPAPTTPQSISNEPTQTHTVSYALSLAQTDAECFYMSWHNYATLLGCKCPLLPDDDDIEQGYVNYALVLPAREQDQAARCLRHGCTHDDLAPAVLDHVDYSTSEAIVADPSFDSVVRMVRKGDIVGIIVNTAR